MYETRGRKSIQTYVDGNLYIVKKPYHIAKGATALLIPKDWIDLVESFKGKPIRYFLLDVKDGHLLVKPYFDDIEGVK